jgi:hypothetical protein
MKGFHKYYGEITPEIMPAHLLGCNPLRGRKSCCVGGNLDSKSKYPPKNLNLINHVRTWPVPMPSHL